MLVTGAGGASASASAGAGAGAGGGNAESAASLASFGYDVSGACEWWQPVSVPPAAPPTPVWFFLLLLTPLFSSLNIFCNFLIIFILCVHVSY